MRARNETRSTEHLRRTYLPDRVRLLFVGEAPPASGRFFYRGDSGLFRAIRHTFLTALPALQGSDFLESFRELGCYLVDLCERPVDRLGTQERRRACSESEVRLSRTIRELQPKAVITIVRSIGGNVRRAQQLAGWEGLHLELPYPGRWQRHQLEFSNTLAPVLLWEFPTKSGLENSSALRNGPPADLRNAS